jgi:hypothetical protein
MDPRRQPPGSADAAHHIRKDTHMIDNEVRHPVVPGPHMSADATPSASQPTAEIDPDDDHVVPQALTDMVTAVRQVNTAMAGNSAYLATEAVAAVGQVSSMLSTITRNLEAYVADYSKPAAHRLVTVTSALADSGVVLGAIHAEIEPIESDASTS